MLLLMKIRLRITVYKELEINHGKNADFLCFYWEIRKMKQFSCETFNIYYIQIRSASNSESEYSKLLYHLYFFVTLSDGLSKNSEQ